jgi:hypothetical protein
VIGRFLDIIGNSVISLFLFLPQVGGLLEHLRNGVRNYFQDPEEEMKRNRKVFSWLKSPDQYREHVHFSLFDSDFINSIDINLWLKKNPYILELHEKHSFKELFCKQFFSISLLGLLVLSKGKLYFLVALFMFLMLVIVEMGNKKILRSKIVETMIRDRSTKNIEEANAELSNFETKGSF